MICNNIIPTISLDSADSILAPWEYNRIAHHRDVKNANFLNRRVLYNARTNTHTPIIYNEEWHLRQSYVYNTCKIDELNEQSIEKNLTPIFITLTLPAPYHPSSKEHNPLLSVSDGYNHLLTMFRALYNSFYVDRKKVKNLKFIRVIEPHKSFIPHLHAIVYVPDSMVDNFKNHFNNIKKRFELKQVDIKILDTAKYAVTYLLKYVQKTLEGDDIVRGWAIHHGLKRIFTMSNLNVGINRQIFSKLTRYVSFDKDSDLNYFRQILRKVGIKKVLKDALGSILNVNYYGVSDSNIFVNVETVRIASYNPISENEFDTICYEYREDEDALVTVIDSSNDYDIEYDIDGLDKEMYKYCLDEFTITIDSVQMYNKKDMFMQYSSEYYSD